MPVRLRSLCTRRLIYLIWKFLLYFEIVSGGLLFFFQEIQNHRVIESFRLEKTLKIMKPNC